MTYLFYTFKEFIWNIYSVLLNGFYYCRFHLYNKKLFSNPPINSVIKDGWELTFDDEFDGTELDFTKWNKWYSKNTGHGPQSIASENSLDCIEVKDGYLHLYTKDNPDSDYHLKTGWLNSSPYGDKYFDQQYGYFEIRCKPPKQGLLFWPAFWLFGKEWPPEIDIFEFMSKSDIGKDYTKGISLTTHFGTPGKIGMTEFLGSQLGRELKSKIDWSEGFHTYACRWEWNYIDWYIDNIPVYRSIYNIPNNKMSVIVNNGGYIKHLPKKEDLPSDFVVDYIRVYKRNY